ncbi:DUF2971 domain-containing protein [Pseudorhizobium flavum]|uniref:DUF2971 domain-containing protein n=1 Tax=Pseudorhizobium flavum TaxID=1335061 RepID=UPI00248FBA7B|nr:DUF2971 domain-containing protein [Pseudorhizobium flavum]
MKESAWSQALKSSVSLAALFAGRGRNPFVAAPSTKISSGFTLVGPDRVKAPSGLRRQPLVVVQQEIQCPRLDAEAISEIETDDADTVTRHLDPAYLPGAKAGQFRFGTTYLYKPKDEALLAGRLGDVGESTQREVFASRSGFVADGSIAGLKLENVKLVGRDRSVAIEYSVNDHCSCLSRGDFDSTRAEVLRSKGNGDLGAYVTYDLGRLKAALRALISEIDEFRGYTVIGRSVTYGTKDRVWLVEEQFQHKEQRDPLAIWLGTTFVKAMEYQHEDEFRLLIVDPERVGRLPREASYHLFEDSRISDAIVASGTF